MLTEARGGTGFLGAGVTGAQFNPLPTSLSSALHLPFLTWPLPLQLENIGNFIKAITKYGVKPHDIFEANDLFENTNHTQVQSTLLALASMVSVRAEWA